MLNNYISLRARKAHVFRLSFYSKKGSIDWLELSPGQMRFPCSQQDIPQLWIFYNLHIEIEFILT